MRGKKSWRYAAVMLILLALAMWGSRQGEAEGLALTREREALESGMQLKTTVSIEKAALPGTDGVLQSVLENSKLTLLREYPDGSGRLWSVDWQLQGASVLDWTGMRLGGEWLEQSNLFWGETVRVDTPQTRFASIAEGWRATALTESREQLADMTARITVVTQQEAAALFSALCAEIAENETFWQPAALLNAGESGDAAQAELDALYEKITSLPERIGAAFGTDGALIFCVDEDAQGNVLLRQMDATLACGEFHAEWAIAEDGRPTSLYGEGTLDGVPVSIALEIAHTTAKNGSKEEIAGSLTAVRDEDALLLSWTDAASGKRGDYSRRITAQARFERGGEPLAELSLTARTTAGEAGARIDGAENIADLSAMDEPARQAWFERMREAASQAVFTVMGRLPKEAAAALLEKMQ